MVDGIVSENEWNNRKKNQGLLLGLGLYCLIVHAFEPSKFVHML